MLFKHGLLLEYGSTVVVVMRFCSIPVTDC